MSQCGEVAATDAIHRYEQALRTPGASPGKASAGSSHPLAQPRAPARGKRWWGCAIFQSMSAPADLPAGSAASAPVVAASAGPPPRFGALSHRNFRLFFLGQGISLIGTWMQNIGEGWLVL